MAKHILTGSKGEDLAYTFLLENGYEILARNWRYKQLEIDMIAREKGILVFVEVKTRKNAQFGFPEEAVDLKKQQKLARAASIYMNYIKHPGEIRFDVIAIILQQEGKNEPISKPEIKLIKDAFWPI